MRLLLSAWALGLALGLFGPAKASAQAPPAAPEDPDLKLGRSCSGFPSAKNLESRLPRRIQELVVLWPRVGRDREADGCVVVARLTAVDHQGLVLTLSARLSKVPTPPEELDYKIVDDAAPPHARFRLAPRPDQPGNIIEARGAPSTSRDTLEASLDFVQPAAFLDRLLPPEG